MRVFVMALVVFCNFILQSTIFKHIRIGGIAPNTALIMVVSYGILRGELEGTLFGFATGLMVDIFFGKYLGYFAFVYGACGFLASKPFKNFYKENYFFPMLLVFITSIINCLLFYLVYIFMRSDLSFKYYLHSVIIPEVLYTTALAIIIYLCMYQINKRLERREETQEKLF